MVARAEIPLECFDGGILRDWVATLEKAENEVAAFQASANDSLLPDAGDKTSALARHGLLLAKVMGAGDLGYAFVPLANARTPVLDVEAVKRVNEMTVVCDKSMELEGFSSTVLNGGRELLLEGKDGQPKAATTLLVLFRDEPVVVDVYSDERVAKNMVTDGVLDRTEAARLGLYWQILHFAGWSKSEILGWLPIGEESLLETDLEKVNKRTYKRTTTGIRLDQMTDDIFERIADIYYETLGGDFYRHTYPGYWERLLDGVRDRWGSMLSEDDKFAIVRGYPTTRDSGDSDTYIWFEVSLNMHYGAPVRHILKRRFERNVDRFLTEEGVGVKLHKH